MTAEKQNSNKRVLLISPEGWQKVSVNLGLALLSAALKTAGFKVRVIDLSYFPMSDEEIEKFAVEFDPFLIGISVKTAQAQEAFRVAGLLKPCLPEARIVAGGPHATLDPGFFFRFQKDIFDYCIMSEGEISLTLLARALAVNEEAQARDLNGVVYKDRERDRVIVNAWEPPSDLSDLPYPDFDSIYQFKTDGFCYPIVSSRGCPYSCIYCCVNLLTGSKKWRSRTPESIVDEIKHAKKKYHITSFEFWDDNFTLDINRAKTFCKLLIQSNLSLSWWCHNGIRADKIDEELAFLMHDAGCTSVAFGIESGTEKVFNSIKKGEKLEDCVKAVGLLKKAGVKAVGYFILGLPDDTLESFIETVRFQRKLNLDHYTFGLLVPYPGTEAYKIIKSKGSINQEAFNSRHFGTDIPEITFDLPNFPRQDIQIGYYLTRYFELYEAVESLVEENKEVHVALIIDDNKTCRILSGLLHSVIHFSHKIKLSIHVNEDVAKINSCDSLKQIAPLFTTSFNDIKNQAFLSDPLHFSVVVTSETYVKHIDSINARKKFVLQPDNPIEALKPVIEKATREN